MEDNKLTKSEYIELLIKSLRVLTEPGDEDARAKIRAKLTLELTGRVFNY